MSEIDKNELIRSYMPFARKLANEFSAKNRTLLDRDDLYQIAYMGLVQAARYFDPSRGVSFAGFSAKRIKGILSDQAKRFDNRPCRMACSFAELTICLQFMGDWEDVVGEAHFEVGSNDASYGEIECQEFVAALRKHLNAREMQVVEGTYLQGKNQAQIASDLGITVGRVSQIMSRVRTVAVSMSKAA